MSYLDKIVERAADLLIEAMDIDRDAWQTERSVIAKALKPVLEPLVEGYEMLLEIVDHANEGAWSNGVTDPTGAIDEGYVKTMRAIDRCRAALRLAAGETSDDA